MNMPKDQVVSEFAGESGMIQPPPHELTAVEEARLMRKVNPADPTDSVEAARARHNGEAQ